MDILSARSCQWWWIPALLLAFGALRATECSFSPKVPEFLQWLDQIGARIAGVALTDFVEGRPIFSVGTCAQDGVECFRGVVATQDITAGSTVVSVPLEIGVYDFDGVAALPEPYADSIPEARLAAWLCRERLKGEASPFSPYLDILPKSIPTPLYHKNDEVEAIRLLPGYAGAQGLVNWTRSEFEKSSQEVLGGASFETFKWAFSNVLSRTFEYRVLVGDPGEEVESSIILMVPFADMVNHSPDNQLSWHVDEGGQRFEMTAARDIRRGEEVFTTYGSKTNEQWMLYYGYVPPDNPADRMLLFETFEEGAHWYIESRSPAHNSPTPRQLKAAVSAAVSAAKDIRKTGSSPALLDGRITLGRGGEPDKRLQAIFATMWLHLDSKHDLGYACSRAISRWSHRKRSECEEGADSAASRALVHLYKKMVSDIEISLVKLRDRDGASQGEEVLVHTNLQVLVMYVRSRKELLQKALLATADFIPFEGAYKPRKDRDL